MAPPKILLLGEIVHALQSWRELTSLAEIVGPGVETRAEFIEKCRQGGFDGVVALHRMYHSVAVTGLIDEELVQALPESVKFICHTGERHTPSSDYLVNVFHAGAGYDQIDVAACSKRQIQVSNVPQEVNDSTADTAIFLMLGALRGFNQSIMTLRSGSWRGNPSPPLGHDPEGKTLGIIGCGGIGRNMAKKAAAFGMKVVYYNRTKSDDITEAAYVNLDDLIESSDVIAISLPLNAATRHFLSFKDFDKMKRGVVVINTARGPIIDEQALVNALESGKVWSCGLDVYENEPAVHPGLIAHPRAMLLPHLGTYTVETHAKMEERCIANVRAALEKGKVNDLVPEQLGEF
ncbi:glyoxylate reductase [Fusarium falciforme]|uniref:Glyoxylate reductase n=1 Tax=Fusarium falciforme TaxID=195108 RepID=A0A9W8R279_9HYPO|nr:glyoxylate reductase [Fusarium falciforme]